MSEQLDNVGAHTLAAQRRAARIANATVLVNATFGRKVIAALQGHWHADDEVAELRFTVDGEDYWLALEAVEPATHWRIAHVDTLADATFVVLTTTTTTDAADRLWEALADVRTLAEVA